MAAYTATSAKLFLAARIQKKGRIARPAITYTSRCSACHRAAPMARIARLKEVAASGVSSSRTCCASNT